VDQWTHGQYVVIGKSDCTELKGISVFADASVDDCMIVIYFLMFYCPHLRDLEMVFNIIFAKGFFL